MVVVMTIWRSWSTDGIADGAIVSIGSCKPLRGKIYPLWRK